MIKKLVKKLKKDAGYYQSWKDNIAIAYIDSEQCYKEKTKKKNFSKRDKRTIANNAADNFLKLLCETDELAIDNCIQKICNWFEFKLLSSADRQEVIQWQQNLVARLASEKDEETKRNIVKGIKDINRVLNKKEII